MRIEEGGKLQHVLSSRLSINLAIQPTPVDKHINKYSMINARPIHCQTYAIMPPKGSA